MFTCTLNLERSTKGTHVYVDTRPNAPIPNVYIKKSAFEGDAPLTITIEVSTG